jgi:hypothetical protein
VRRGDDKAYLAEDVELSLDDKAAAAGVAADLHQGIGRCKFQFSHRKPSFGFRVVRPGQRFARALLGPLQLSGGREDYITPTP